MVDNILRISISFILFSLTYAGFLIISQRVFGRLYKKYVLLILLTIIGICFHSLFNFQKAISSLPSLSIYNLSPIPFLLLFINIWLGGFFLWWFITGPVSYEISCIDNFIEDYLFAFTNLGLGNYNWFAPWILGKDWWR